VPDLLIEGNDLVIATHGRSFYVLDDITPLRQLTPALVSEDVHLFQSPAALRNVGAARIDYYLAKPADKVTIEILDAAGKTVRTFTGSAEEDRNRGGRGGRGAGGAAAAVPADQQNEGGGDEGGGGGRGNFTPPVPRKAGLNHFQWDQRYPGAKGFNGMVLWGASTQGPLAVPGAYQVRLTANGRTLTGKLELQKDPRLDNVTTADLAQQFTLATQVRDRVTEANETVIKVRELKKQMDDRLKKNQDAALKSVFDKFREKITEVEEAVYQVRNRSGQDPLNFPIKLNNKLAALEGSIERGDGKPTGASFEVYNLLQNQLDEWTKKLASLLLNELPPINKLLADRKLEPLVATTTETQP
jgi:hypothetical protein